jgi:hypothetical protein
MSEGLIDLPEEPDESELSHWQTLIADLGQAMAAKREELALSVLLEEEQNYGKSAGERPARPGQPYFHPLPGQTEPLLGLRPEALPEPAALVRAAIRDYPLLAAPPGTGAPAIVRRMWGPPLNLHGFCQVGGPAARAVAAPGAVRPVRRAVRVERGRKPGATSAVADVRPIDPEPVRRFKSLKVREE